VTEKCRKPPEKMPLRDVEKLIVLQKLNFNLNLNALILFWWVLGIFLVFSLFCLILNLLVLLGEKNTIIWNFQFPE